MLEGLLVRDVMRSPVTTIAQDASLLMAALAMRRDSIRHLAVVEGVRLVGVITERDLLRASPSLLGKMSPDEYNTMFQTTQVFQAMNKDPVTVSSDTPLRQALEIVIENKLGCLPVVDGDCLNGIITRTDLLRILARCMDGDVPEPQSTAEGSG
jgi:acetoin utilization protein AcuB